MALKIQKYALLAWFIWACAAIAISPEPAKAQATETVLHNFDTLPKGGDPGAGSGLIRDGAGNLYGTAPGGPAGGGVAYKIDTSGRETVLYAFTDPRDPQDNTQGLTPSYPTILAHDPAGNLYGTTFVGGSAGFGVVFKLDPGGHQTVLYNFTTVTFEFLNSPYSSAGVIRDAAGNLYGTTYYGGDNCYPEPGCGVVYKLDPAGNYSVLHNFTGGSDGSNPTGSPILDSAGNLYGTTVSQTESKGSNYNSAIYKLDPAGKLTVLCHFGESVLSSLTLDSAGNLYGTAAGLGGAGQEVVFKVVPTGSVTVLYTFASDVSNAFNVLPAGVVRDAAGNLYGTTFLGGLSTMGSVFKLDPSGHMTVLHSFKGGSTDGAYPVAGVIGDAAGNLYGTTESGGPTNTGAVFKLDVTGNETLLHSFFVGYDGIRPSAGVIADKDGHLYGTTSQGGMAGFGVVYKLDATVGETVLHTFTGGTDGNGPNGLIRDSAGNLYGTTVKGGSTGCTIPGYPGGCGVVYSVDTTGNETVLYRFTGGADGANPAAGVIRDSAGNLYGTTEYGGAAAGTAGSGVVYKLDAAGEYSVLYTFTGGADGGGPLAGVILDSAGNLYGTAAFGGAGKAGVVYKVDPTGKETVLYNFTGGADGGTPYAGVIRDSAGNLYGTTYEGGHFAGVVYKLDPAGKETVLHTFTEGAGGGGPYAGVIGDSAGNLYGTTYYFGASTPPQNGWGVVYKLDAAGEYSVLYTFTGGADGSYPQAGLIRDSAGNLYGTTVYGGRAQAGTVFRIKPQ